MKVYIVYDSSDEEPICGVFFTMKDAVKNVIDEHGGEFCSYDDDYTEIDCEERIYRVTSWEVEWPSI
jgi:uncharacterized protein involved in tellurium resistance